MGIRRYLGASFLVANLVLAFNIPCSAKNLGVMTIFHDVVLRGRTLSAGQYFVQWKTHSPQATVMFQRVQKGVTQNVAISSIIFVANGRVEQRSQRYAYDAAVFTTRVDGTRDLIEIHFAGSNTVLVFD